MSEPLRFPGTGDLGSVQTCQRGGVTLAYVDTRSTLPPIVFVHGCGDDHTVFENQLTFFSSSHRVIAVDLRGHGSSDAPEQDYTVAGFAEDLAWLCTELSLNKPVLVGHSMGGNIVLDFAARYPDALSSLIMIDSCVLPTPAMLETVKPLANALQAPGAFLAYQNALQQLCLPTDRSSAEHIRSLQISDHVLASSWLNHVMNYDGAPAAAGCRVPLAYIGSIMPFIDLPRFQALTPQLEVARTLGSGHFSPLEVPDQIDAMVRTFLSHHEQEHR